VHIEKSPGFIGRAEEVSLDLRVKDSLGGEGSKWRDW